MPRTEASKLAREFILFISGVLISALFSAWIGGFVVHESVFLITVIILLSLSVIFFLGHTGRHIEDLCTQAVSVVDYVSESYLEDEGIEYKGIVFEELAELIKNAENEILIAGSTRPGDKTYKASDHKQRKMYHRAIESKVKANLENDFKYIRINQGRPDILKQPPENYLGSTLLEHYEKISKLKKECMNFRATIDLLNVPWQYLTSIWFIDRKFIVVEVTGITEDSTPYAAGLIRITDRGGNISSKFQKIFEELQRKGQPIKL